MVEIKFSEPKEGDRIRIRFLYHKDGQPHFVECTATVEARNSELMALRRMQDLKSELSVEMEKRLLMGGCTIDYRNVLCVWKEE